MQMKFTYIGYIQTGYHLRALKNVLDDFFTGVSVTIHFSGAISLKYNALCLHSEMPYLHPVFPNSVVVLCEHCGPKNQVSHISLVTTH